MKHDTFSLGPPCYEPGGCVQGCRACQYEKLQTENAKLRAEVKEWKDAARKEREYSLGVEKNRDSIVLQNRQLQEKAYAWKLSYEELARKAKAVMDDLEKHGPGIVPHLIDTDDNDGEFLRREIRFALGPDEEAKTEKRNDARAEELKAALEPGITHCDGPHCSYLTKRTCHCACAKCWDAKTRDH